MRVKGESNERGSAPQNDTWIRSVCQKVSDLGVHREVGCRPWHSEV